MYYHILILSMLHAAARLHATHQAAAEGSNVARYSIVQYTTPYLHAIHSTLIIRIISLFASYVASWSAWWGHQQYR
jgi:hypothetical protein